jgi:hypothetical protein
MNHEPKSLAAALDASIEFPSDGQHAYDSFIYRFNDSRLRYEMHLHPTTGSAFLSLDPDEPMQGCPMLEFSFRFTHVLIGRSHHDVHGKEIAIRFYEGEVSDSGQRLTLSWVPEGYWYIWADALGGPAKN